MALREEQHRGTRGLLAYHLTNNHPFIDGNKRTAWVCMRLFLKLNSLDVEADRQEKVRITLDLAAGRLELESLTAWITSKTRHLK